MLKLDTSIDIKGSIQVEYSQHQQEHSTVQYSFSCQLCNMTGFDKKCLLILAMIFIAGISMVAHASVIESASKEKARFAAEEKSDFGEVPSTAERLQPNPILCDHFVALRSIDGHIRPRDCIHHWPSPFPLPTIQPRKLPECSVCTSSSQCKQGKCWGTPLRCTDGTYHSLLRCGFRAECQKCTGNLMCATHYCNHGRCVLTRHGSSSHCSSSVPEDGCH